MEKRYQVFVSSTYTDLKEERQSVIQALMEMDCIPSGMEIFPAADEEQFEFIKKVIDDCDYYLLIIGARYGSTTKDGISYTEKEYDYAVEKGLDVIAMIHESPDELPVKNADIDPELREKLQAFRDKVSKGRLVKYWKTPDDLAGKVSRSLLQTIKAHPAVGWIRADIVPSTEILSEINELRKDKEILIEEIERLSESRPIDIPDLATLDDEFKVFGDCYDSYGGKTWDLMIEWEELFGLIAPYLLGHPNESVVKSELKNSLFNKSRVNGSSVSLDDQVFQTIKIQLLAHNLVKIELKNTVSGGRALFWSLTDKGNTLMIEIRSVRSKKDDSEKGGKINHIVPKK